MVAIPRAQLINQLRLERQVIQFDLERRHLEMALGPSPDPDQLRLIQEIRLEQSSLLLKLASRDLSRMRRDGVELAAVAPPPPAVPVTQSVMAYTPSIPSVIPAISPPAAQNYFSILSVSGYKNFDFSYAKGTHSTGLVRSESLKLQVAGVSAGTTINVAIDQSTLGTDDDNKTQIEIINPNFKAVFGQFKTDFADLDLLRYNAQLDGVQTDAHWGPHQAAVIYSTARGGRKKEFLYGNNSQGPFVMKYRPVVPNSEQILLNGVALVRATDYQIDYTAGSVRFSKRIVTPEDQIQWSYESENESFKDRISGMKYWFSQSDATGVGVTWMQKNEQSDLGQTSAYLQRQLAILHLDQSVGSSNIHAEYGLATLSDDLSRHEEGNAFAVRGHSTGRDWSGSAYYQTVGSQFQSIDSAGLVSGDIKMGGEVSGRVGDVALSGGSGYSVQTINGVPVTEGQVKGAVSTQISTITTTLAVQDSFHSESPATGNKRADFHRNLTNATVQMPYFLGALSAQVGQEQKQSFITSADTFVATSVAGGIAVTAIDQFNGAVEGNYRFLDTQGGKLKETATRVTSGYRFNPTNMLTGFAEYKTRTNAFSNALISVASELRPNKEIGFSGKIDLENLRESVGTVDLDMDKWALNARLSVEPMSFARFKINGKLNAKIPKGGIPPAFSNQELAMDATLTPFKLTTIGIQHVFRDQLRSQLRYYPQALFTESKDSSATSIFRVLHTFGRFSFLGQYETERDRKEALVSTADPTLAATQVKTDKFKGDLSTDWSGITLGGGFEALRTYSEIPTTGVTLQNIYTAFTQFRPVEILTTQLSWSYIYNLESEEFISTKPQLDLDLRLPIGSVTLRYSRLQEMRSATVPVIEIWELNTRVDLNRNVSVINALLYEKRQQPDSRNLNASGRISINF